MRHCIACPLPCCLLPVGSLLQWKIPNRFSNGSFSSTPEEDVSESLFPELDGELDHDSTVLQPAVNTLSLQPGIGEGLDTDGLGDSLPITKRLFKSKSGNAMPTGSQRDHQHPEGLINFPKFRRSVSATIGEYSQRLGLSGYAGSGLGVGMGLGGGSGERTREGEEKVYYPNMDMFTAGVLGNSGSQGGGGAAGSKKEGSLSQGELLDRFKKLVTMATDFVLYSGINSPVVISVIYDGLR